jgi:hypothetical protein
MATRHELVIAARAGSDDAFMDLVHIETPEAYRLTLAILRQPHDAEDALQEAFVPRAWTGYDALKGLEIPGAEKLTLAGYPARFSLSRSSSVPNSSEVVPNADEVLWWVIPLPFTYATGLSIAAAIRAPGTAELEARARSVVESIAYDHTPKLLPTDADEIAGLAPEAIGAVFARAQAQFAAVGQKHALDCFPHQAGASRQASITETLNTAPMSQPLPVTCTTAAFEANAMRGWTLVLEQTWAAGSDYPAGEMDWIIYAAADGMPMSGSAGEHLDMYPHVGASRSGG